MSQYFGNLQDIKAFIVIIDNRQEYEKYCDAIDEQTPGSAPLQLCDLLVNSTKKRH